ncbi:FecCD family ABC transporter permease [Conexibacter woesei]|uniref:Transport system permease protein n=1 Tax=Conexibacter woesei (strain DSM 14684 / CCUG 47730 / CIP 108061 / JCM 11494 / NBRC 100937 / ID131577) TaxID=469383 RepID=D3F6Q6_CONWI|nr:iron chelate uptake ABC transporter family permease subunit [Conexibacter woesei]ADB52704.1 transport system permease protein [Conexibacter woesei DSM 14684]
MSAPGLGRVVRVPLAGVSLRVAPRVLAVCALLAALCFALFVLSIGSGSYPLSFGQVVTALLGGGDAATTLVVETLRLPRALTAVLVGGALGAAGAIFQSITRNPLGSPDVIGFTSGAAAAAVLVIVAFGGSTFAIAAGSVAGGLLTAVAVYLLAWRGGVSGYRLVLVGIGLSAMLLALTDYLLTRARVEDALVAASWIVGSLDDRGWEHVRPIALALVVLVPLVALLSRPLRALELGDDAAAALGVTPERARLALLVVGVLLTAVATAAAGPIVFVALAAPQIGRRLTRAAGPGVGTAALTGAVLLLASDLAAQHLLPDRRLPVGIVTGVAGGVFLLWLLSHEWRGSRRG